MLINPRGKPFKKLQVVQLFYIFFIGKSREIIVFCQRNIIPTPDLNNFI